MWGPVSQSHKNVYIRSKVGASDYTNNRKSNGKKWELLGVVM